MVNSKKDNISKETIKYLAAQIVLILEYLHSNGIAHRDFKPENLLMNKEGKLKCIDFGTIDIFHKEGVNDELFKKFTNIQKRFCEQKKNDLMQKFTSEPENRKSFVGTTFYVAPEMIMDQDSVTCAADLWAFGIILYRLAKNQYLFDETNDYLIFEKIKTSSFELAEDLDSDIRNLIMKLLVNDPAKRIGNGENGFEDLKSHPFFEGIDWNTIGESESPLKSLMENQPSFDEIETNSQDSFDAFKKNTNEVKKMIISGLVKKMKYYFLHNTRQLILFNNSTLEYHDPFENILKGIIKLTEETKIKKKDENTFTVTNPDREFVFKTLDVPAEKWVFELRKFLSNRFD